MYTDPISDMLTRIRNGYMSRKDTVNIPFSKNKMALLSVLKQRKFIEDYKQVKNDKFEEIEINLNPEIYEITLKRISKPGQRIYQKYGALKKVHGGLGVAVVSTPKGIMSGEEAKKMKLGGEVLCEVY